MVDYFPDRERVGSSAALGRRLLSTFGDGEAYPVSLGSSAARAALELWDGAPGFFDRPADELLDLARQDDFLTRGYVPGGPRLGPGAGSARVTQEAWHWGRRLSPVPPGVDVHLPALAEISSCMVDMAEAAADSVLDTVFVDGAAKRIAQSPLRYDILIRLINYPQIDEVLGVDERRDMHPPHEDCSLISVVVSNSLSDLRFGDGSAPLPVLPAADANAALVIPGRALRSLVQGTTLSIPPLVHHVAAEGPSCRRRRFSLVVLLNLHPLDLMSVDGQPGALDPGWEMYSLLNERDRVCGMGLEEFLNQYTRLVDVDNG